MKKISNILSWLALECSGRSFLLCKVRAITNLFDSGLRSNQVRKNSFHLNRFRRCYMSDHRNLKRERS